MSAVEIREGLYVRAKQYGGDTEGWKRALRESAVRIVREGKIRGYLAFDKGVSNGWCNANDRMNYCRVGEFDLSNVPEDEAASDCQRMGQIKSIVCFEISPEYRGKGIATQLLEQVCADAQKEGYTGPVHLYERAGFTEFSRRGTTVIMRKTVK